LCLNRFIKNHDSIFITNSAMTFAMTFGVIIGVTIAVMTDMTAAKTSVVTATFPIAPATVTVGNTTRASSNALVRVTAISNAIHKTALASKARATAIEILSEAEIETPTVAIAQAGKINRV